MQQTQDYQGKLEEGGLAGALARLVEAGVSGLLTVSDGKTERRLYIESGGVVYTSSDAPDERIGESLVRAGKLTPADLVEGLKVHKASRKPLGGVLVERGLVKPKELFNSVKSLVREILSICVTTGEGSWKFNNEAVPPEIVRLQLNTGQTVFEALRGIDDWTRVSRGIPGMEAVLKPADAVPALYSSVRLSASERSALSLFDGVHTIKEILEKSEKNELDALKTVFVLYSTGLLEVVPRVAVETGPALDEVGITAALDDIRCKNHYEILGLEEDAPTEDIESACARLIKEYDPDRSYPEGKGHLREALEEIRAKLTEARNILADDSQRWEYDLSLAPVVSGKGGHGKARAAKDPEGAKAAFSRGVADFRNRDFVAASEHFIEATRLDPTKAPYFSYLALAFLQRPRREADAEEAMLAAVRIEPDNADHRANLGLLYQKAGIKDKAREAFAEALKLDPNNAKALAATGKTKK